MTREEAATVLETATVCCGNDPVEATFEADCDEVCDALQLAISALREQEVLTQPPDNLTQWISVKDRRREYKTRVLFVDVRGLVFLAIDSVDWDDGRVSFLEPASGLWVQGLHWMPLPEAPKEV